METIVPLVNHRNHCCFNVILQALMHTPQLHQSLDHIWGQIEYDSDISTLVALYTGLSSKKGAHLMLAEYLSRTQDLPVGIQHDALEVYEKFLAQIEKEVSGKEEKVYVPKNVHKLVDREYRSWEMSWRAHGAKNTLMASTNAYQIDQFRCMTCRRRIHSMQLFNSIRLVLPDAEEKVSIPELLQEFLKEKEKEDPQMCDACKVATKNTMVTRFYRAPEVLVFAIQRAKGYTNVKDMRAVEIPETLDFGPALVGHTGSKMYKRTCIVMHHGARIDHGHYTALVENGSKAMIVDDDRVLEYKPAHKQTVERSAYMVFYSAM